MLCKNTRSTLLLQTPDLTNLHIPQIHFQLGVGSGPPPRLVPGSPLGLSWGVLWGFRPVAINNVSQEIGDKVLIAHI